MRRRRWSHFEKKAREATGQSLGDLLEAYAQEHGNPTAQEVSHHITMLIGEEYSPMSARYGCQKHGIALAQGPSQRLRGRHRGQHQRLIADYCETTFPKAIYTLARSHDPYAQRQLARKLGIEHNLSLDQTKQLTRCLVAACAIEAFLTLGTPLAGGAFTRHLLDQETDRARQALEGQALTFEGGGSGTGIVAAFEDGGGVLMVSSGGRVYMRLETDESLAWYRHANTINPTDPKETP